MCIACIAVGPPRCTACAQECQHIRNQTCWKRYAAAAAPTFPACMGLLGDARSTGRRGQSLARPGQVRLHLSSGVHMAGRAPFERFHGQFERIIPVPNMQATCGQGLRKIFERRSHTTCSVAFYTCASFATQVCVLSSMACLTCYGRLQRCREAAAVHARISPNLTDT